jgi:ABC-type branched-subunit amino acid transport system ATPase component
MLAIARADGIPKVDLMDEPSMGFPHSHGDGRIIRISIERHYHHACGAKCPDGSEIGNRAYVIEMGRCAWRETQKLSNDDRVKAYLGGEDFDC